MCPGHKLGNAFTFIETVQSAPSGRIREYDAVSVTHCFVWIPTERLRGFVVLLEQFWNVYLFSFQHKTSVGSSLLWGSHKSQENVRAVVHNISVLFNEFCFSLVQCKHSKANNSHKHTDTCCTLYDERHPGNAVFIICVLWSWKAGPSIVWSPTLSVCLPARPYAHIRYSGDVSSMMPHSDRRIRDRMTYIYYVPFLVPRSTRHGGHIERVAKYRTDIPQLIVILIYTFSSGSV